MLNLPVGRQARFSNYIILSWVTNSGNIMKTLKLVLILVSLIVIQSCSDVNNPQLIEGSNDIIPLAVGNTWDYHTTLYDTTGNVFADFHNSNKIIGDTIIGNSNWYYYDIAAWYCSIFQDGYHVYDPYETDSLKNRLSLKYPCTVGDKYSFYEVAKIDTQITVPAGSFSCVMYTLRMQTSTEFAFIDFFIKPGVGYVKTIEYGYIANHPLFTYRVSELIGYKLR